MKIVVDSNIIFSAILNTGSNISKLLTEGSNIFEFYSIYQLIAEINLYKDKIMVSTKYTKERYDSIFEFFQMLINFVDLSEISEKSIEYSFDIVKDIDIDDAVFVALSLDLNAKLWTGDRKLINGLHSKGLDLTITTSELIQISNDFENNIFSTN